MKYYVLDVTQEILAERVVISLQRMMNAFLSECQLKINGEIVEPLQVEAYYRNGCQFDDENVHGCPAQKNNFGKLYFHKVGRGGVDICLSNGDYHLSLLLKTSRIGDEILTQTKLAKRFPVEIRAKLENKMVLEERPNPKAGPVFFTKRKGLVRDTFKDEKLGAIIDIESTNLFAFGSGGKLGVVRENIVKCTPEDMKKYLGYVPKDDMDDFE